MTENEIATTVVDACYQLHTRLGPGLLESVHERVLEYELKKSGVAFEGPVEVRFGLPTQLAVFRERTLRLGDFPRDFQKEVARKVAKTQSRQGESFD